MHGYERDEYEDLDEYEEDVEEQEEEEGDEYGYEETRQPTQEELEYLALRERLKESIRKQMKKESGATNGGTLGKVNAFRKDNYGSFFGPSQPVIAQRVIQESKSLLENPHLVARISRPNHANKKISASAAASSKPRASCQPKISNGLKKKVELLKNTRDYSFLLSEDAEVPASVKNPPSRNTSGPKSDARSAQVLPRSKQVVNDQGKIPNGHDRRKQIPSCSQTKPRVGLEKMNPAAKSLVESRKLLGGNNGSVPGRSVGPKGGVPSRGPGSISEKVTPPVTKSTMGTLNKPARLPLQAGGRKPTPAHLQSGVHRQTPHGETSLSRKSLVERKEHEGTSKTKVTKPALTSSRDQVKRPPPKPAARGTFVDERPKAKPSRPLYDDEEEDPDGVNAISMIRQMFRYNPNKFRDDDDDSDMEANFEDIMREEKRSEKIARKEDEEQLCLIEEEERRKRMRLAKKRKLSHH